MPCFGYVSQINGKICVYFLESRFSINYPLSFYKGYDWVSESGIESLSESRFESLTDSLSDSQSQSGSKTLIEWLI